MIKKIIQAFFLIALLAPWGSRRHFGAFAQDSDDDDFTGQQFTFVDLNRAPFYFDQQVSIWGMFGLPDPSVRTTTSCGALYLGGPNILGTSGGFGISYIYLPEHYSVYITFTIGFIDTWAPTDRLFIDISGKTSEMLFSGITFSGSNVCGQPGENDQIPATLIIQSYHDEEELSIYISKLTAATTSQFVLRDLQVSLAYDDMPDQMSFCLASTPTGAFGPTYSCACAANQYYDNYWGSCQSCDSSCATCLGPSESQCLTCPAGYSFNGAECFRCDPSCQTCSGPGSDECSSCVDGKYLFFDLTCQSSCPFTTENYYGDLYCHICTEANTFGYDPDDENQRLYYFPDDQTCKTVCPSPYVIKKMGAASTCIIPLSKTKIEEIRATSTQANVAAKVMTAGLVLVNLLEIASAQLVVTSELAEMFEFTRYIDVVHSPDLEVFYKSPRATPGTLEMAPELSNSTIHSFGSGPIPTIFTRYGIHSDFLVNFWTTFISLLFESAGLGLLYGIQLFTKKRLPEKYWKYVRKATVALFAFLVGQFYSVYAQIILYNTVSFRAVSLENAKSWVSFFIGIIFFIFSFVVLVFHGRIIRKYQTIKRKNLKPVNDDELETFKTNHEGVKMFFDDYKDTSYLTQSYLLFITIRTVLFSIIVSTLFEHPIAEMVLLIILNVLVLFYVVIKRPFENKFETVQQALFEVVLLLTNICFLIMACQDHKDKSNAKILKKTLHTLGNIVIGCIYATKFVPLVVLVPKYVMKAIEYYKIFAGYQQNKKLVKVANEEDPKSAPVSPLADDISPVAIDGNPSSTKHAREETELLNEHHL